MTNDWIKRADMLEAACMQTAANNPDDYDARSEAMERIVWQRWFAWFPIRTMDMYCGATHPKAVRIKGYSKLHVIPGKWRWLAYVKRHNLYRWKFKES